MGLLANELRPIAVLRAAAARHRHLAVGMHRVHAGGRDKDWQRDLLAHHGRRHVALTGAPATCGAKPSSPNAATLSSSVNPVSTWAISAEYTDLAGVASRVAEPRRPTRTTDPRKSHGWKVALSAVLVQVSPTAAGHPL